MNDPRHKKPDEAPSPERDTSQPGREEEVINQQEKNNDTNAGADPVINAGNGIQNSTGEQQFREGIGDNTIKLDEVEKKNAEGSDLRGSEASDLPGSGI